VVGLTRLARPGWNAKWTCLLTEKISGPFIYRVEGLATELTQHSHVWRMARFRVPGLDSGRME
jgi:hypothetical protein